eukprot:m51a1_g8143 hypothetical protein (364) ;mRNA; r:30257-31348
MVQSKVIVGSVALCFMAFWVGVGSLMYVEHATPVRHVVRAVRFASSIADSNLDVRSLVSSVNLRSLHHHKHLHLHNFCSERPATCELALSVAPLVGKAAEKVFAGPEAATCTAVIHQAEELRFPIVNALIDAYATAMEGAAPATRNVLRRVADDDELWQTGDHHRAALRVWGILESEASPVVASVLALPRVREAIAQLDDLHDAAVHCGWRRAVVSSIGNSTSDFWAAVREVFRELATTQQLQGAVLETEVDNEAVARCWEHQEECRLIPEMRPLVCKAMGLRALLGAQMAAREPEETIAETRARLINQVTSAQGVLLAWVDNDEKWAQYTADMASKFLNLEWQVADTTEYVHSWLANHHSRD